MDDVNNRLLALLRADAAQPLKTLAAQVGLSVGSVRERIMRLQASGIIRRFTIETALPGEAGAVMLVRLDRTPDMAVVGAITARPEVIRCYSLSGETDLMVEVVGGGVEAVNASRDQIASLPGVAGVVTSMILRRDLDPAREGFEGPL